MNKILNTTDTRIEEYIANMESTLHSIEKMMENHCPILNGEKYISDAELSKALNVSRRSLHDYRAQGRLAYYFFGGKILYKESDILKILNDNKNDQ